MILSSLFHLPLNMIHCCKPCTNKRIFPFIHFIVLVSLAPRLLSFEIIRYEKFQVSHRFKMESTVFTN